MGPIAIYADLLRSHSPGTYTYIGLDLSSRAIHDKSIETACTYRVCLTAWRRPVSIQGESHWCLNNYGTIALQHGIFPQMVRVWYGGFQIPTHVLPSSQSCWMQYDIIVDRVIKRGGCINTLSPEGCGFHSKFLVFKSVVVLVSWAFRWIAQGLIDDKSTLTYVAMLVQGGVWKTLLSS